MGYCNSAFSIAFRDCITGNHTNSRKKSQFDSIWKPPPEDWVKSNVHAFGKLSINSTSVGYMMRDNHGKLLWDKESKFQTVLFW